MNGRLKESMAEPIPMDAETHPRADLEAPRLSIIIVSYNTRELTLTAIRTALQNTSAHAEVIVFDNASTDGSADAIEAEFPQLHLIRSEDNLGFAGANNAAAQHARGAYLLLLNPDTETHPGAIDTLLAFAEAHPAAGIWGGKTYYADGRENPSSCWNRQTLPGLLCQAIGVSSLARRSALLNPERILRLDHERDVDIVSGCFLLIRRALFERLEGFDPAFFMYGEDADLCLRAGALGFRPKVTPEATIVHHGGKSERVQADKLVRLLTAKVQLVRRHFRPGTRGIAVRLLAGWPLSRMIAHRLLATLRHGSEQSQVWTEVWARRHEWLSDGAEASPQSTATEL